MITPKTVATQLVLILLAAGAWWLAEELTPKESPTDRPNADQIDYYSTQVTRTVMTPEGKPKEVLVSESMTHYKGDDRTELVKPVMTLLKQGNQHPWTIKGETGTVLAGGTRILVNGEVLISRTTEQGEPIQIFTRNVRYEPNRNYAETDEKVLMLSPQDETRGTGMQAFFEPELKFNLLAHVRRKHEMR